jgi:DNA-binding transcriptional MerR regulator
VTAGLRTGEVAAAAGVNRQTLRYYERRGLLPEPERTPGGHRVYPGRVVTLVLVIKAAQRLGFTLQDVTELIDDAGHRGHGAGRRRDAELPQRVASKLTEVQAKIDDLQLIASTLRAALDAGCEDVLVCTTRPDCPLPFAEIAQQHDVSPTTG